MNRRIEVTYSTMGQSSLASAGERKDYRWNGDPDKSEAVRTGRDARSQMAGCEARTARRQLKINRFAVVLAELGYPDPAEAPNLACVEAGKRVGVGDKTAKSYRTALKKQRLAEETPAPPVIGEDAEPAEIVAPLHEQIARQHPALAAAFRAIPPGGRKPASMRAVEAWKREHRAGIQEAKS